ncbi:hypothetical protein [Pseudorhizobium flavum]|uniref:hypothetical protein n=1 Tax=Pseudorhizobium flavum TaxID=1335061 RepID=UPI0037700D5C
MPSEISFYPLTQGEASGDVEGAEVGSSGGPNATPFMMSYQIGGETLVEAFGFANVDSVPVTVSSEFAGDVYTRAVVVDRADWIQLKAVNAAASTPPINDGWV